jgi:hypothetical protein
MAGEVNYISACAIRREAKVLGVGGRKIVLRLLPLYRTSIVDINLSL